MKVIIASFKPPAKPDDVKDVQASGFYVAGEKFVTLKSDDSRLYGKKVQILVSAVHLPYSGPGASPTSHFSPTPCLSLRTAFYLY